MMMIVMLVRRKENAVVNDLLIMDRRLFDSVIMLCRKNSITGKAKKAKVNLVNIPRAQRIPIFMHFAVVISPRLNKLPSKRAKKHVSKVFENGRLSKTSVGQALASSKTGIGTALGVFVEDDRDHKLQSTASTDITPQKNRGTIKTSSPERSVRPTSSI
jgi:hypothetical protein